MAALGLPPAVPVAALVPNELHGAGAQLIASPEQRRSSSTGRLPFLRADPTVRCSGMPGSEPNPGETRSMDRLASAVEGQWTTTTAPTVLRAWSSDSALISKALPREEKGSPESDRHPQDGGDNDGREE